MGRKKIDKLARLLDFIQKDHSGVADTESRKKIHREFGELLDNSFFYFSTTEGNIEMHHHTDPYDPAITQGTLQEHCDTLAEVARIVHLTKEHNGRIHFDRGVDLSCHNNSPDDKFTQNLEITGLINPIEMTYRLGKHNDPTLEQEGVIETNSLAPAFFDLLEGLSTNRLKKCVECSKIFVQKTARPKRFCSVYCKNKNYIRLKEELLEVTEKLEQMNKKQP